MPAKKTILVVDDMAVIRDPIAVTLHTAGYHTLYASNGRAALEVLKTHPHVDLILLDVVMPEMGGLAFLQRIRSQPATAKIPVILLSAAEGKKDILDAAKFGVHGYMLKSHFSLKELLSRVRQHLERAPAPAVGGPVKPKAGAVQSTSLPSPECGATSAAPSGAPSGTKQASGGTAKAEIAPLLTREDCLQRAEGSLQGKALSGVVAQVVSLATSPRGDMSQLASLVGRDPLLSARVLQAANSAAYASTRGVVSTIPDAVRQIGCAAVRNVATTLGIFDAMPASGPDGFNPIRCWQHSFAVAMLCERLAQGDDAESGVAYLVGLCHDLGEILFRTQFGPEYRRVLEVQEQTGKRRDDVERAVLGITHGELVLTILRCIGLPDPIRRPIEAFHGRGGNGRDVRSPLSRVLRLADAYANGALLASAGTAPVAPLTRAECREATGQENPEFPESAALRGEIFGLTAMLARLSPADEVALMQPAYPAADVKVWLARDPSLSSFDPIAAALGSVAELVVSSELPTTAQLQEYAGLVVVAASTSTSRFTPHDINKALSGTSQSPPPVLWLIGRVDGGAAALCSAIPSPWPLPLERLAAFVRGLQPRGAKKVA